MQLEEFFDFQRSDDIRIRGTRIGIESVLYEYTHRGQTPEKIAARFPTVTLEQVYATILFYLHNKETVSAYLADWLEWGGSCAKSKSANLIPASFICASSRRSSNRSFGNRTSPLGYLHNQT